MPDDTFQSYDVYEERRAKRIARLEKRWDTFSSNLGVDPQDLALLVAQDVSPEEQYDFQMEKFQNAVIDYYGTAEQLADPEARAMLFQDWQTKKKFGSWNTQWPIKLAGSEETIMRTLSLPELSSRATTEMFGLLFQIYGEDTSAMALQTALIQDPERRAEMWSMIEDLAGRSLPLTSAYHGAGRGIAASAAQTLAMQGRDPNELMQQVLLDPGSFDSLTDTEQRAVVELSQHALDTQDEILRDQPVDIATTLKQGRDVIMQQGGYKQELSPEERRRLQLFVSQLPTNDNYELENQSMFTGDVDVSGIVGDLGIAQYRNINGTPVFSFNKDDIRSDLAKHVAVVAYLRGLYPNAEFSYDPNDQLHEKIFSLWDRGVDKVAAIPGTLAEQVKEATQYLTVSPDDKAGWQRQYDAIKKGIESGDIPDSELTQALAAMYHAQDYAHADISLDDIAANIRDNANPQSQGAGFGDAMASALSVYPGDKEYEAVHAAFALVGQLAFDPTILLSKFVKPLRLAGKIPAGTVISRSRMAQFIFDSLAMPPEVLLASRRGRVFADGLVDIAKQYHTAEEFATHLNDVMAVEMPMARRIAEAANAGPDATHAMLLDWIAGGGAKAINEARLLPRIEEASRLLGLEDELPRLIKNAKARLKRRTVKAAEYAVEPQILPPRTTLTMPDEALAADVSGVAVDLTGDAEGYVYHLTTPERLPSIIQEGALPQQSLYGLAKHAVPEHMRKPRLFVADSLERAEALAPAADHVALRVKASDFGQAIPEDNFRGSFYANTSVSPDKFEILGADGVWRPLTGAPQQLLDEIVDLNRQVAEHTETFKSLRAKHAETVAEKVNLESILRGSDFETITPLHKLPSHRSIRKLAPGKTTFGRAWDGATAFARALPIATFDMLGAPEMARYLEANPIVEKAFNRFAQAMRRFGQDTGTGKKIFFETSNLPEGMLADEAGVIGYKHMRDFARFIGTPDEIIDEWITAVSRESGNKNIPALFKEFVRGYENVIDNASRLSVTSKHQLRNMWNQYVSERAASYVKEGKGIKVRSTPTLWVPLVDDAGDVTMAGTAAIEADFLNSFTLPTFEQMRDHVTATRSYLKGLNEAGNGATRLATGLYFGLSHYWRSFNAAWARFVLAGRMPVALPARIQLEQAVRIEAWGYSSWVRHPIEWFKSVKGWDEFALAGESPAYAFMTIMRDYLDDPVRKLARRGRQTVNLSHDTEAAVKSLAGRIKAYAASPSMRVFLKKGTDAKILEEFKNTHMWAQFQPLWDRIIEEHLAHGGPLTSYEKILGRIRLEAKQIIGTGEAAEKIRAAALSGKMKVTPGEKALGIIDKKHLDLKTGQIVTEDGNLFAEEMLRMYNNGEWVPDVFEFPRSWGDYIPMSGEEHAHLFRRATDWMFQQFYARPDLYFGRSPLFRQVAAREFKRLRALGYSEARATEAARAFGARQTADILFTIGANSSADHTLRALMPFFPAWKELATTWLARIPAEIGGGGLTGWAVGAPALVRRTQAYIQFFQDTGLLFEEGGQWKVRLPGAERIIKLLTGLDVGEVTFSADSMASLLPTPSLNEDDPFWKGLLPTLGAPSGVILDKLASQFGGIFQDLEDNLTLFGGNQSLAPAAVDYVFEAFGVTLPWMDGQTREMHDMRRESAFIDALRLNYAEHYDSKPQPGDYKNEKAYVRAEAEWLEQLYDESERDSRNWYLLRGMSSLFLPFSIKYSNDAMSETTAMWDVIDGIQNRGDRFQITTPLLESYRQAHPELELYLTGKTVSLVGDNPERTDSYEQFLAEIEEGDRLRLTPKQWLVWALGNQEAALHRSRMNEIFEKYASTPQRWLLAGFEATTALRKENLRWDAYLGQSNALADVMDVRNAAGEPVSFSDMYSRFYEAKKGRYDKEDQLSLTLEQEKATEALDALDSLANFFGAGQYTDDSYLDVKRTLNEIADKEYSSKEPVFKAISWWWDQVRPYFDAKDEVWSKIKDTPTPQRAPLYRQLADIENEWATKTLKHPKWGAMPAPQEVMFQKLSPAAKELRKYDWSTLPVEFLSRFQRQKVYGASKYDDKLDELVGKIAENERALETIVDVRAISTSSTDYEHMRAATDRKNMEAAKELGVAQIYTTWLQPPYMRVGTLVDNPYWTQTSQWVTLGRRFLEANETSPRGSTPAAVEYQRRIVRMIEDFRDKNAEFDHIMEQLEIAYGEGPDQPAVGIDTYWPLFFEGFGTAPGYLAYY